MSWARVIFLESPAVGLPFKMLSSGIKVLNRCSRCFESPQFAASRFQFDVSYRLCPNPWMHSADARLPSQPNLRRSCPQLNSRQPAFASRLSKVEEFLRLNS